MKAPLLTHYFIKKITKSPRYTILDSLVFDDFILADELFAKALQISKLVYQLKINHKEN